MVEKLSLAETDPTQSIGPIGHMTKWGGRLAVGAFAAVYFRETTRWFRGNSLFQKIEEVINHEHQEAPEDHEA